MPMLTENYSFSWNYMRRAAFFGLPGHFFRTLGNHRSPESDSYPTAAIQSQNIWIKKKIYAKFEEDSSGMILADCKQ